MTKAADVVICTFGKHRYLRQAIETLKKQTVPDFNLIVVDNNPVQADLEWIKSDITNVMIFHRAHPDLSAARNLGIEHSRSEYVLFIDDDVIPSRQWIECMIDGFKKYGADMVGGRVDLEIEGGASWVLTHMARLMLSQLIYDNRDVSQIIPPRYIVGANMGLTKLALNQFGGFLPAWGRIGTRLVSGEDVEMVRRIFAGGGKISFINNAVVTHKISKERTRLFYLLRRAFWQGFSDVLLEKKWPLTEKKKAKPVPIDFSVCLEGARRVGRAVYRWKEKFQSWGK